jgi:hypothetical protein
MSKEIKGTNVPVAQSAQTKTAAPAAKQTGSAITKADEKKSMEDLQEELHRRLEELKRKQTLASHRERFLQTAEALKKYGSELKEEQTAGHFDTQNARITFQGKGKSNYQLDEIFAISNVTLIAKFVEVLFAEVSAKIQELEHELIF